MVARKLVDLRERSAASATGIHDNVAFAKGNCVDVDYRNQPALDQRQQSDERGYPDDVNSEEDHDDGEGSVAARTHATAAVSIGPSPGTADHALIARVAGALSSADADFFDVAVQQYTQQRIDQLEQQSLRIGSEHRDADGAAMMSKPRPASAGAQRRPGGGSRVPITSSAASKASGVQLDTTGGGDHSLIAVKSFHPAFGM